MNKENSEKKNLPASIAIFFKNPVPYETGTEVQQKLVNARMSDEIPDTIVVLEHTPVFTMGIRAKAEHVLCPRETLERQKIALAKTTRGGDVTYHGPGQLVMYPVLKLKGPEADVHKYVEQLEEVAIRTAKHFGVTAFRRPGMTGAWTDAGKIAAIGVRVKRWTTFHGMSFNVNPDLSHYDMIIPCGLKKEKVTSLSAILGQQVHTAEAEKILVQAFSSVFRRKPEILQVKSCSSFNTTFEKLRSGG